ncbi:MAG: class I SAM-dependent methyltransferase [Acidimicrobiia bacterium]
MSDESGFQVDDSAPRRYQELTERFMHPFAEALTASVKDGDVVLDVACGTGIAARVAATLVGNIGQVVGADINAAMVNLARAITEENQDGIRWDEASALNLPYDEGRFDRVISQQGVQFFPDPEAGLKEMARVTRMGGTMAVTVWSDLADSPYFDGMYQMLLRFCDVKPDDMAWSSTPQQIDGWFEAAGISRPEIQRVVRTVSLPPPLDYIPAHMLATPWAPAFDSLSSERKSAAVGYMAGHVDRFLTEEGMDVPFSSYLATTTV